MMKAAIIVLSIALLCGIPGAGAQPPKTCRSPYVNCATYKRIGRTFAVCVRWQITCSER